MIDSENSRFSPQEARAGKLGLSLSGGGFRAALFHVGVLAQMAERDLLRHVSVISTVSGGSIIGAFYYLKVKQLLEGRRADQLTPSAEAYTLLVREIETEFLAAVQQNLRVATFADSRMNARMLGTSYNTTMRLADLFNQHFFTPISGDAGNLLRDLPIQAVFDTAATDVDTSFAVPQLVVNATALNTGHLFQFTGDYVGEPRVASVVGGTSTMSSLRRLDLDDPTLESGQRRCLHRISLGDAVAASCCIPGLLEPFSLAGLYRDDKGADVVVRVVDGGVFDNQGLVSLNEAGCSHFVCSDGSDLLQWQSQPLEQVHRVAMRANDIMMDRIRSEQMNKLSRLGGDKYAVITLGWQLRSGGKQGDEKLIKALSALRTDLDAFTDLEACALMYYGYRLSEDILGEPALPEAPGELSSWGFYAIDELTRDAPGRQRLQRALDVGSRQLMKVFYLGRPLPYVIVITPMLIPVVVAALLVHLLPPIPVVAWVVLGLLAFTGVAYSQNARIIEKLDQFPAFLRFRRRLAVAMRPLGVTVILGVIGSVVTWVNLRIFNRLFLRYGRIDTLKR